jgi:hypothetical protein
MMYLKISVSVWLSLKAFNFDTKEEKINSVFTILATIFIVGFPVFIHVFLLRNLARLQDEIFAQRFNSLYLNVNNLPTPKDQQESLTKQAKYPESIHLVTFFIVRRLIYAVNCVLFSGSTIG